MLNKEAFDRFFSHVLFWFMINLVLLCALVVVEFVTLEQRTVLQGEVIGLISNILVGTLVSFAFYFLVVHLPEKQRRNRLRRNFLNTYLSIKEGLIWQIVFASKLAGRHDLDTSSSQIEKLMNVTEFRTCFSGGREADEGWYAFANHMSDDSVQFREIVLLLSQLKLQTEYVLLQDVFDQQKLLDFFSWLRIHLLRLEKTEANDYEKGPLLGFLYQLLSGWDPITGYRDFDYIEREANKIL